MKVSSVFFLIHSYFLLDNTHHGVAADTASMTLQSSFIRRRRLQTVTTTELKAANTANNCWIQIGNTAYDVTAYAPVHPGGSNKITSQCGNDVTQGFNSQPAHAAGASLLLMPGIVNKGVVVAAPSPTAAPVPAPTAAPVPATTAITPATTSSSSSNPGTTSGVTPATTSSSAGTTGSCNGVTRLTLEEVQLSERCIIIFYDKVFDLEEFIHPGGQQQILRNCNSDGTVAYAEIHKENKLTMVKALQVGVLKNGSDDPCVNGSGGNVLVGGGDDDDNSYTSNSKGKGKGKGKKNKGKKIKSGRN